MSMSARTLNETTASTGQKQAPNTCPNHPTKKHSHHHHHCHDAHDGYEENGFL